MARPTWEKVEVYRRSLTELWTPAWEQWRRWEELVNQEHFIEYAAPARVRKLGLAQAKIQAMVDTLVTTSPKVTRKPINDSKEAAAKADKVEKWGAGLLRKAASQLFLTPPYRTAASYLSLLGYAAGVVRWDDELWPKEPERGRGYRARLETFEESKKRAFPFILEFPHPGRVLLPSNEKQPSMAIEIATMFKWQVDKMMGRSEEEAAGQPFDLIQVVTYWDEDWRGMFADTEEVKVTVNGLGFIPWTHGFAGYGRERMPTNILSAGQGATTPASGDFGPTPKNLARGLLAGVEDSIVYLDEDNTAKRALTMLAAYPVEVIEGDAEEYAQQKSEGGLGAVISVTDITKQKWQALPNVAPWMENAAARAMADVEMGTVSSIVQGQRTPGTETATQHAMMLGASRQKFEMPMQQLNYFAAQQLAFCAKMLVARGERVTIDDVTCGADDFQGYYEFEVDFMAKDEGTMLRDKADAREEYEKGLIDFKTYQDIAGRGDASGLSRSIFVEKALQSEQAMGPIIEAAVSAFRQKVEKEGVRFAPQEPAGGPPTPEEGPTPFTAQPNGPVEAQQVTQGMTQGAVPAEAFGRVVPR